MQKIKLLKLMLIPTLGISTIGIIAAISTSCESRKKNVKITANEDSTLELINHGGNSPILQYSTDEKKWQNYEKEIKIPTGTSYYFKGWNLTGWSISDTIYSTFLIQGNVSISGNIIGLLDNGKGTLSQIPNNYCFYGLFQNSAGIKSVSEDFLLVKNLSGEACYAGMFMDCTKLEKAPNLPAISLPQLCYYQMFKGCTSLTIAPELPATYLTTGCYNSMFDGCTSLTAAPNLPTTRLANGCYYGMFNGCISLTKVPDLPATTLTVFCYYQMFNGCASLTKAPNLPATALADYCCNYMFSGCTALTAAPDLPATTLANGCYYGMFAGCTSLETVPNLSATNLADMCYYDMFNGCTKLKSIKINYSGSVQDAPKNAFYLWVNNIASSGTFYYNGNDTLANFGFPSGWAKAPIN